MTRNNGDVRFPKATKKPVLPKKGGLEVQSGKA
jgi:hypothetical protein